MSWAIALAMGLAMATPATEPGEVMRQTVVYTNPDGRPLKATLFQPVDDGATLRPAILLIHGSGWRVGTRHLVHWYARQLAEHGYVALSINYRKMPDYPYPHCVHDAKAAVRWLRLNAREYRIDPDRIGVFGNSAGGNLAAMLAATKPEDNLEGEENPGASTRVRAAAVLYGAVDLTLYAEPEEKNYLSGAGRRYMTRVVDACDEKDLDAFRAASPLKYADEGTAPTLLIHGEKDHVVRPEQSRRLHARLQELGVATRLVMMRPGRHGFDYVHHGQRREVFTEMLAWFDEYVRNAP